jgi:multidrug resistance efflux pump
MLTSKPRYRRSHVLVHGETFEWTSLEDCLAELAEIKAQRKAEKKKAAAMRRAIRREEAKLAEVKKKLALAKLALIKGRQ